MASSEEKRIRLEQAARTGRQQLLNEKDKAETETFLLHLSAEATPSYSLCELWLAGWGRGSILGHRGSPHPELRGTSALLVPVTATLLTLGPDHS